MRIEISDRGVRYLMHRVSGKPDIDKRLVSESSAIGDYHDSYERPGSSFLWIGDNHHLNREEVAELVAKMQYWLDHKRLPES
jgi:hypothetical protein